MNEDREVTVTVTPEDMDFRNRAKAAGLPDILISMYGTALRKLIADEREAEQDRCCGLIFSWAGSDNVAQRTVDAIRKGP